MSIVKLNNNGVKNATAFGSITGLGDLALIKKITASSSASISFVNGASSVVLDSTYKEYIFIFNNIHPATDGANFTYQFSIDGGSNYNTTITSTAFNAQITEGDSDAALAYQTGSDLAQGTDFSPIKSVGGDNDQSLSGTARLFEPSSTVFVKHFMFETNHVTDSNYQNHQFEAGYVNSTSAVNAVQFKMSSGNIDAGSISLYGVN